MFFFYNIRIIFVNTSQGGNFFTSHGCYFFLHLTEVKYYYDRMIYYILYTECTWIISVTTGGHYLIVLQPDVYLVYHTDYINLYTSRIYMYYFSRTFYLTRTFTCYNTRIIFINTPHGCLKIYIFRILYLTFSRMIIVVACDGCFFYELDPDVKICYISRMMYITLHGCYKNLHPDTHFT